MTFPCARKLGNICCGHKVVLNKIRNIFCVPDTKLCPQQMLRARANGETFASATICVRNNVSSFASTLRLIRLSNSLYTLFWYKNVVFPAQAEYSYFSAHFGLKIFRVLFLLFLNYSLSRLTFFKILFCGLVYHPCLLCWALYISITTCTVHRTVISVEHFPTANRTVISVEHFPTASAGFFVFFASFAFQRKE